MGDATNRPADLRTLRRRKALRLAERQAGVIARRELYAAGITRAEIRANVQAGRWQRIGHHCVVTHGGGLDEAARHWSAAIEAGPRALIDGESSLILAGLTGYTAEKIRVSVPRGARVRHRHRRIDIRQTRRLSPDDRAEDGLPRTRNAVAAVRAALWAKTVRQAELLLTMTVQQGLAPVEELASEMLRVRRDKRRTHIHGLLIELAGGIGSLGELDLVRGCRERGLPEPSKQVLRRTPTGTYYLDIRWAEWRVVIEVDGIQHGWAQHAIGDAIRHNSIALAGDVVLRLPVLGLRVCPDDFFAQIRAALIAAGWSDHKPAA